MIMTKAGGPSPPQSEHGDGGDDEEKSVLQVKTMAFRIPSESCKVVLEELSLQAKLTNLAINIGYGGMAISFVTVLILFIRFSIDNFYTEVNSPFYSFEDSHFQLLESCDSQLNMLRSFNPCPDGRCWILRATIDKIDKSTFPILPHKYLTIYENIL